MQLRYCKKKVSLDLFTLNWYNYSLKKVLIMKPTIAIFIHDPQCETECALGMIDGLVHDFDIRTFGLDNFTAKFLHQFDAVCFPGGMGDSDDFYDIFTAEHIKIVQDYVADGGKYFGICMGAYWAGSNYFDITPGLTIGQYIERPTSDISYDGATLAEVTWLGTKQKMYFYDGCAILGESWDMDTYATYANGDPMAVIKGNVGIIGCHPEALPWWFREGGMEEYYDSDHAYLMVDFVKQLVNNE
jgi:glutamine amidotransferase-like uncharacterized protein